MSCQVRFGWQRGNGRVPSPRTGPRANVKKMATALDGMEFFVAQDHFLTPTARYCDVVLPATTFLEREDIVFAPGIYYLVA